MRNNLAKRIFFEAFRTADVPSLTENAPFGNFVHCDLHLRYTKMDMPELHPKWDYSAYQENFPFFSAELDSRLRAWNNNTLINASRYCTKLNDSGFSTALKIRFPGFGSNVDPESDFLTFGTFHPVLVQQKSRHDLATIAYLSILELWPLLVLCFSCAALAGMIIWVLVSIN